MKVKEKKGNIVGLFFESFQAGEKEQVG